MGMGLSRPKFRGVILALFHVKQAVAPCQTSGCPSKDAVSVGDVRRILDQRSRDLLITSIGSVTLLASRPRVVVGSLNRATAAPDRRGALVESLHE